MRTSQEERSESNAVIERWIEEEERGTAAAMLHAGATPNFPSLWSRAAKVFDYNYEKLHTIADGAFKGLSPFEATWGREFQGETYPFGCLCSFVARENERDKFERRSRDGVFLQYGTEGSVEALDLPYLKENRIIRTLYTRDFQMDPTDFPLRDVKRQVLPGEAEVFQFVDEEMRILPDDWELDDKNVRRCKKCQLVVMSQPVTCHRCIHDMRHGRGRKGVGCRKGRCRGHLSLRDDGESGDEAREAPLHGTSSSPDAAVVPGRTTTPPASPVARTYHEMSTGDLNAWSLALGPMLGVAKTDVTQQKAPAIPRGPKSKLDGFLPNYVRVEDLQRSRVEALNEMDSYTELLSRIKRSLGAVAKVYPPSSNIANENEGAAKAVTAEFVQLVDAGAINPNNPKSWEQIKREVPDARICDLMMVIFEKNIEAPELRRWKARAVCRGDLLRGISGDKIVEGLHHAVPASLELTRFLFFWEVFVGETGTSLQGDVPGAYLKAKLTGPRTFIRVPKGMRQASWTGWDAISDPVIEALAGIYGLPRGDTAWGGLARNEMKNMQFEKVQDTGEDSLWIRRWSEDVLDTTCVSVYADNFHITGRSNGAVRSHQMCADRVGFSKEYNYTLTDIIGMEREPFYLPSGQKALFVHNTGYAQYAVSRFQDKHYGGKELPCITTPLTSDEPTANEKVPLKVPKLTAHDATSHGGEVNWAARCNRFDLSLPGKRIMQRVTAWEHMDAAMLFRIFCYWKTTVDLGIVITGDPRDVDVVVVVEVEVDSDLANDVFSARSTSAVWLAVSGPNTCAPMTWGAKGNPNSARNTAEAEEIAIDRGAFLYAMPICSTLEVILKRVVRIVLRSDNDAALIAARKGYSRKLSYLKKWQKTSLSALRELFVGAEEHEDGEPSPNILAKIGTKENRSDLGTKPLDHQRHWSLVAKCRMQRLANIRLMQQGRWASLG